MESSIFQPYYISLMLFAHRKTFLLLFPKKIASFISSKKIFISFKIFYSFLHFSNFISIHSFLLCDCADKFDIYFTFRYWYMFMSIQRFGKRKWTKKKFSISLEYWEKIDVVSLKSAINWLSFFFFLMRKFNYSNNSFS